MLNQPNFSDAISVKPPVTGQRARSQGLLVRLADSRKEIAAVQALRYRVFFEQRKGRPSAAAKWRLRDFDAFDDVADHLLVIDPERGAGAAGVIAAVRLLRGRAARALPGHPPAPGFSTSADFDIRPLLSWPGEIVELGPACLDPGYPSHKAYYRLWQGVATYLHAYNIELMFGAAGLPGAEPIRHLHRLAYLHHARLASPTLRPHALPDRFIEMDNIPAGAVDWDMAWRTMPAAIKSYLRLGATVGRGAVVKRQLDTLDVCLVVRTGEIPEKYRQRYLRWLQGEGANA